MIEDQNRRQKTAVLGDVMEIIDFSGIEKLLLKMYKGKTGRPPIPPLMLFKALLLESWYGLSDVEVVQEIHVFICHILTSGRRQILLPPQPGRGRL